MSQGLQFISLQAIGLSAEELTDNQSGVLERRVGRVVDALFKEFQQLDYAAIRIHKIRLGLSGLYTDLSYPVLDVFVSRLSEQGLRDLARGSIRFIPVS